MPARALAQSAPALPSGGNVVAGSASIGTNGTTTTIQQTSDRAIINWNDFSVGQGGNVRFENGSGATLNRVTGTQVSRIDGNVSGSGSVYLINANGIVVGKTGVINTGGTFVASTLDVADADFMRGGDLHFAGNSRASVVNLGRVGALGGNVSMIGVTVVNQGTVNAANGTAAFVAGSHVLLRDTANGAGELVSVLYGDAKSSVANGGLIAAASAELRAQQGNVYALAGNTAGTINANGIRTGQGKVWLVSDAGTTHVAGTITARGVGGTGGFVETSGRVLELGNAHVLAPGGHWLLDPPTLAVDASAAGVISNALQGNTDVTLTTFENAAAGPGNVDANGNGDILINAGIAWTSGATLTLNAWNDIAINADINAGAGKLALIYGQRAGSVNNSAEYRLGKGVRVNLSEGQNFSTQLGSDGDRIDWTVITRLGDPSSSLGTDLQGMIGNGRHYVLGADIDARATANWNNGLGFRPLVGNLPFDGLGHVISGLMINRVDGSNVGLFQNSIADIRNVSLVGVNITGTAGVGAITGVQSGGTISNVFVSGQISGRNSVGGLVGVMLDGTITGSSAQGEVRGTDADGQSTGGLVGALNGGTITRSYANNNVTSVSPLTGGIVGYLANSMGSAVVDSVYWTGTITGTLAVGGIAGSNNGTITRSFSTGTVTGNSQVGGLVGVNGRMLKTSYSTADIVAAGPNAQDVGGLVGFLAGNARLDQTYFSGTIQGQASNMGAVIGNAMSPTFGNNAWNSDTVTTVGTGTGSGMDSTRRYDTANLIAAAANFDQPEWSTAGGRVTPYLLANAAYGTLGGIVVQRDAPQVRYRVILNVDQLQAMRDDLAANYVLGANIDARATQYWNGGAGFGAITRRDPDGYIGLSGMFDGFDFGIDGLTINGLLGGEVAAMFSGIESQGTVQNLRFTNVAIQGFGGVATLANMNRGTIRNVSVIGGSVRGNNNVGGLVAQNNATIADVTVDVTVDATSGVAGGLAATNLGTITGSHARGNVSADFYAGGFAGYNGGSILWSDASGNVTGGESVGGLVGQNDNTISGELSHVWASGTVTGRNAVGGLVGVSFGRISDAAATGAVTGTESRAGGLVGMNRGAIDRAFSSGAVNGASLVGGLVGDSSGRISDVYTVSQVFGADRAGGLVGQNSGQIANAIANGTVSAGSDGGAFTGATVGNGSYSNSFWNSSTAGLDQSGLDGVTGLTTAALAAALPAGFDTAVWANGNNRTTPYLVDNAPTATNGFTYLGTDTGATPTRYTVIQSATQLQAMANDLRGHYLLGGNIDASDTRNWNLGAGFASIGSANVAFTGTLDGLGYTIDALTISRNDTDGVGLFGVIGTGAALTNLLLTKLDISGGTAVGALVGRALGGTITNVSVNGRVRGDSTIGGLVGYAGGTTITGASALADLRGNARVGGLVGDLDVGTVSGSWATGTIAANGPAIGGLVGINSGRVSNSYATGQVTGGDLTGGLVGLNNGSITLSYATGATTGRSSDNGPADSDAIGGLVGHNNGSIDQSYAAGSVSGRAGVGGLVGENHGAIARAYAIGAVTGALDTGGFVGAMVEGSINQSFSMGLVNAQQAAGGFIGRNLGGGVAASYWNTTSSGQTLGTGFGGETAATGLTTAQLAAALPAGFSAVDWANADNLTTPYLRSHVGFGANGQVYLGKDGSDRPTAFQILTTLDHLNAASRDVMSGGIHNYALGADIDASATATANNGMGFVPIGTNGRGFSGRFNGLGHVIRNLTINAEAPIMGGGIGLFGTLVSADVSNLGLVDAHIRGQGNVGGIAGAVSADSTLDSVFVTGSVESIGNSGPVGGLVGVNSGMISQSWSSANVSGTINVGGLVGENHGGTIAVTYATGLVTGTDMLGGLVGQVSSGGIVTQSYTTGALSVDSQGYMTDPLLVGGLVGLNNGQVDGFWNNEIPGIVNGIGGGNGFSHVDGHSMAELKLSATFRGWDVDTVGGLDRNWRLYEGATTPLLKAFLTTATVGGSDKHVTYDGNSHVDGSIAVLVNGVAADPSRVFGTALLACTGGNCTDAGTYGVVYAGGLYSGQLGYDLVAAATPSRLVIDPRAVTVTYTADAATRIYGDADPRLTGRVVVDGLIGNDQLSGTAVWQTAALAGSSVGRYAITGGGLTASSNYVIQAVQAAGNAQAFSITPRAITVTANAASAIYGDRIAPFTYTVGGMGLVNGDAFTGALSAVASKRPQVGTYAIGQGTLELSPNYAITYVGANLTITPRDLTVTYTADALSRVYGNANPALTGSVAVAGLVYGDSVGGTAGWSTAADTTSGVGSYAVTGGGITASANYTVHAVQAAGNATALAVTPRTITVTADALSRVYGDANPALTYTLGGMGLVNGDTLTGALATAATATSNVGNYAIGQGSLAASANYVIAYTGANLAVTPRALTVTYTAGAGSRVYGDANPALTGTVGVVGLVNGDQLTGTAAWTSAATATSNVGNYAVTGAGLGASANYTLTSVQAAGNATALAITPRGVTVTYTANAASRLFGAPDPVFGGSVAVAGLIGGDTLSGTARWFTTADGNAGPGTYAVNGTGLTASANYRLTEVQAPGNASALTILVNYIPLPQLVRFNADPMQAGGPAPALVSPRITQIAGCSMGYGCTIRTPAGF